MKCGSKLFMGISLMLSCMSVSGQLFRGGALLGFNASQVDGDTYAGYDRFGLMGGAYIYTALTSSLDLQFEIKYMGKGAAARRSSTDDSNGTQYRSNLHYIELPLLLRYNLRSGLGIELGTGFGYLFSYSESDSYGDLPPEEASRFKSFELSGILGGSYPFSERWKVDLRYSYSITPIINYTDSGYVPQYFRRRGAFNNLFSLGVYYRLGK